MMINSLTDDFNEFIKKISLNSKEEQDIISKHNGLTEMIKHEPPIGYKILNTRLSGSYAKHTVLNEYKEGKLPDVDIIVIIEKNNKNIDKINTDFLNYFNEKKGKVTSNIRQQSNSIGLIYSNISADMVIGIMENNNLKITSAKQNKWIDTNCIKHIDFMIEKNKAYEGFSYYSLMKLIKYLNKEIFLNKLKSYTIEQIVHQCAPSARVGLRLHQAFAETLFNIANISSINNIKDCCDDNKKGYDDKDVLIFPLFIEEIKQYSKLAEEAIHGDRKKWEEVFGNRFPKQSTKKVKNEGEYDKTQTPWCY